LVSTIRKWVLWFMVAPAAYLHPLLLHLLLLVLAVAALVLLVERLQHPSQLLLVTPVAVQVPLAAVVARQYSFQYLRGLRW
jgi:hypothetical protein